METLQEQIARNQEEARQLQRQLNESTPADGLWNPADYIKNSNFIAGGTFKKQFNKIPEDAQKYIQEQIYKRQQSGYPVTKSFLRVLQWHVRSNPNWDFEGKRNFDISGYLASDKGMAKRINKQSNNAIAKNQTGGTPQNTVPKAQGTGTQGTGTQGTGSKSQGTTTHDRQILQTAQTEVDRLNKQAAERKAAEEAEANRKKAYDQNLQDMANAGAANEQQKADLAKAEAERAEAIQAQNEENRKRAFDQNQQETAEAGVTNEQQIADETGINGKDVTEDILNARAQQQNKDKLAALQAQSNQITQDTVDQINDSTDAVGNVSMPKMSATNTQGAQPQTKYTPEKLKEIVNNNAYSFKYRQKVKYALESYNVLEKKLAKAKTDQEKAQIQDRMNKILNGEEVEHTDTAHSIWGNDRTF